MYIYYAPAFFDCFFFVSCDICRVVASVTTTSISSRQRPKPRGGGAAISPSTRVASSTTSASVPAIARVHSNSPLGTRAHSRLEMPTPNRMEHLQLGSGQASKSQSKSWDTGLDMFGAVPFASPAEQVHSIEESWGFLYIYMWQ